MRKLRKTGDSTAALAEKEIDDDSTKEILQPEIKKKKKDLPVRSKKSSTPTPKP